MTIPARLVEVLRSAKAVAVLTGAGISAESGVPTFRDAQTGLWAKYQPTELATPEAFRRDPQLVWDWYDWRRKTIAKVRPNAGHLALTRMERQLTTQGAQFTLITQNVDSLHQLAATHNVVELHGNLYRVKCFAEDRPIEFWEAGEVTPPRCPECGGPLRPAVVWFGEALPSDAFNHALQAAAQCEVFFSIGTSSIVEPAASLPRLALEYEAVVVEINPEETPLTASAAYILRGRAGEILPELVKEVWG